MNEDASDSPESNIECLPFCRNPVRSSCVVQLSARKRCGGIIAQLCFMRRCFRTIRARPGREAHVAFCGNLSFSSS